MPAAPAFAADEAGPDGRLVPALRLGTLGGLLPRVLSPDRAATPDLHPALGTSRLIPGGLALRLQGDEPDDSDLMPDLVPLVDPNEVPDEGDGTGSDPGMSFDAVDLSDGGEEGTATPNDEALVTDPNAVGPATKKPILSQWWFWAAVGVVVVGTGGAVAATSGPEIVLPEGSLGTMDRR